MGCYDIFCSICGIGVSLGLLENNYKEFCELTKIDISEKQFREYISKIKWIKNIYFMTATNKLIKNCKEINGNNVFYSSSDKKTYTSSPYIEMNFWSENNGYFIHKDCYNFVKKNYNINLVFGDFFINFTKKNYYSLNQHYVNFGNIKKYWEQFFDYAQIIKDKNFWMVESPLVNTKNASRIKKNIKQLKIKSGRSGPSISASFYKNGDIKIGNDGYFWIIKNNKWMKINEKPIIEIIKTKNNLFKKIPQIGYTNKEPSFIKDYNDKEIILIKL